MNETLNAIATRYSCRGFTAQMPTQEQLNAIATAAVQAPSGLNRQPWQVIVVRDKALIGDMEAEAAALLQKLEPEAWQRILSRGGRVFYGAQCLVVVATATAEASAAMDCGILCENMAIAATSLGLGSLICGLAQLAFAGARAGEFARRLGFAGGYGFGIALLLGQPAAPGAPHEPDMGKIHFVG